MRNATIRFVSGVLICAVLLTGLSLFLPGDRAYACSCVGDIPVNERLADASAVFLGTVADKDGEGGNYFDVERIWKGTLKDNYVYGGFDGMCGMEFALGEKYLIYTHRNNQGQEATGLCSGNKMAVAAAAEMHLLDELVHPTSNVGVVSIILVVAAVVLAAVYASARRRGGGFG